MVGMVFAVATDSAVTGALARARARFHGWHQGVLMFTEVATIHHRRYQHQQQQRQQQRLRQKLSSIKGH